jgi:superfamily II DNA helicase RecQ
VFRYLEEREEKEVQRIWDVVGLVRSERCQTGVLLERFGGPGEALERCGHCEWCLRGSEVSTGSMATT